MTFETEDRQRKLAEQAREIVIEEARWADQWEDRNPVASPALVGAVVEARKAYAADIKQVQRAELNRAQHVIDMWAHHGWGTAPAWARSALDRLQHLDNEEDDAIAALSAALR